METTRNKNSSILMNIHKPHNSKVNYTDSWYLTILLLNIFAVGMYSILFRRGSKLGSENEIVFAYILLKHRFTVGITIISQANSTQGNVS